MTQLVAQMERKRHPGTSAPRNGHGEKRAACNEVSAMSGHVIPDFAPLNPGY
jgi:hypothetical protein